MITDDDDDDGLDQLCVRLLCECAKSQIECFFLYVRIYEDHTQTHLTLGTICVCVCMEFMVDLVMMMMMMIINIKRPRKIHSKYHLGNNKIRKQFNYESSSK